MSYEADSFIKACSDPNGFCGECHPDGTPMTNKEKYLRNTDPRYDSWH